MQLTSLPVETCWDKLWGSSCISFSLLLSVQVEYTSILENAQESERKWEPKWNSNGTRWKNESSKESDGTVHKDDHCHDTLKTSGAYRAHCTFECSECFDKCGIEVRTRRPPGCKASQALPRSSCLGCVKKMSPFLLPRKFNVHNCTWWFNFSHILSYFICVYIPVYMMYMCVY